MLLSRFSFAETTANCSMNAGIDQTVCVNTATLTGDYSGSFPVPRVTIWSQVSGPSASITDPSSLVTSVTGLVGGNTYKFRISSTCLDGSATYDEVNVFVSLYPTATAGNDTTICAGTAVGKLHGSLISGQTGLWTITSGGTGLTINNPTSPTATLTLASGNNSGLAVLRWSVTTTATSCTAYDEVNFTKNATQAVSAGSNTTVTGCYNSTTQYALRGSYTSGTSGTWSVVSGPNTPSFLSLTNPRTTVSNLIPGVYVLRWTVSGVCVNGSATVQITVNPPTGAVSAASASISGAPVMPFCTAPSQILLLGSAFNPETEEVLWTKVTGTATIASPTSRNTIVTGFDGVTTTTFNYKITNKATPTCLSTISNNISVSFEAGQSLSISTSKPFIVDCDASTAIINVNQTGATIPQYSVISGPTGIKAYTDISGNSFTVTGLTLAGTYLVRVRKVVGNCTTLYDEINLIVSKGPSAANAGSDLVLACNVTSGELIGNTPAIGTGRWTQLSGPTTAVFATPTTPRCAITGLTNGVYQFRWTISSGPKCPTNQDEVYVRIASAGPTTANAGTDQSICNTTPLYLYGNSPLFNEVGTWTVSPSSGVTFSNVNAPRAIVTGLAASTSYTFTWSIVNSCGTSSDNVIVTTSATAGPIAASAGTDQCLASGTTQATLAGNDPLLATGTWTQRSGATATITNSALYNTTVTGMSDGTYTFEWALARNECTITRDTVMITISPTITTADAGADQLTICGTSTNLAGNTPIVGTGMWTQLTGSGGAVINTPTSPTSAVYGLIDGLYTFRWTISNNACSSYDDVSLYASTPPTAPNAGADKSVCSATSTAMAANTIATGTGYWSMISGPNSPTIANNALPTTNVSTLVTGEPYVMSWNSRNGLCAVLSDTISFTVLPTANAGTDQTLCGTTTVSLVGNANTRGWWTFVSPAQSTETTDSTSTYSKIVNGLIPGTSYTFKYSYINSTCPSNNEDQVVVNVLASPTSAIAGSDMNMCIIAAANNDTTITMAGNTPTVGTGAWALTSTPVVGNITSPSSPTTTITGLTPGIYTYSWTISNGTCTSVDYVTVRISKVVGKSAGDDMSVCGTTATMAATAASSGIGTWSKVSGPNTPVFASSNLNTTAVTGLIPGTYVLRWTITDGTCSGGIADDMSLTVSTAPTTPDAGQDQNQCNVTSITLAGNTISTGTGTWSRISGPNTPVITDVNSPTTTVTSIIPGTYVFQWAATNGSCTELTDQVSISNLAAPTTANAGSDFSACLYSPIALAGNSPSVGTGLWTQILGSEVSFTDATSPTTSITGAVAGSYRFMWTITNGTCTSTASSDLVDVIIDQPSTVADAGIDQTATGTSVTMAGNTISGGSGLWTKTSGPEGAAITTASSPTTTITGLTAGVYVYRWTSTNGSCSSYDEMSITKNSVSCVISNKMISPMLR
jgi:hypothetical protein